MKTKSAFNLNLTDKLTEAGSAMLFSGFADIMPNPDPILKKLGHGKDVETYEKLLTDAQLYGAIENNRKAGVKALLMYLDNPETPENEMEFFRKYFDKLLDDGVYDNIVSHCLDTPQYGRMIFQLQWGLMNNYYVPIAISPVSHKNCAFNMHGELLIRDGSGTFNKPEIEGRYIVMKHKPTTANPYGEALLSKCYWNIIFKKEGMKLWAQFIEKHGMPHITAQYEPQQLITQFGASDLNNAVDSLLDALDGLARDGIMAFPDGTKIDLIKGNDISSAAIYEKMIRICDEQNTKLQLGHSGATESTSGDKLSNDTTATDVRRNIIDADKKFPIVFWNKVIEWIHYFNFAGTERPKFDLYAKEDVDMAIAERDAKLVQVLANSGVKFTKEYLYKTYGFEEEDIQDEELEQTATTNTSTETDTEKPEKPAANISPATFLAEAQVPADQKTIDEWADALQAEPQLTDAIIANIIEKLNKTNSYDELKENIDAMIQTTNTTNFEDKLTRTMFLADILGRLSVQEEVKK